MAENKIIAIDIGSTKIVSAFCKENGHAVVLTDEQANRSMISCIAFTDRQRLFGFAAQCQATVNPKNTIFGGDLKNLKQQELSPLRLNKDETFLVDYRNKQEKIDPEELIAMMLSKVKLNAENYLESKVERCVVTIPSCFTTQQRLTIQMSCEVAGFTEVQMINDTTASALTYAFEKDFHSEGHNILIFDIGATSTEASIVHITKKGIIIKANAAELNLGGDNFVTTLIKYFIDEFKAEKKVNLSNDDQAIARLRVGCEKLKKALSTADSAKVTLETFYQGNPYDLVMTRQMFELRSEKHFQGILNVARQVFQSTLIQKSDIVATILVGGGGRIPKIQQDLKDFMDGAELSRVLNADEAIATGAAYYGRNVLKVQELPRPRSLFGDPVKDIQKMKNVLQKFDDDDVALVDYMAHVNELEKLCYSYKRAIGKQDVTKDDKDEVLRKSNEILSWLEEAQTVIFDRNDFKIHTKELKEIYSTACNKKHSMEVPVEKPSVLQPMTQNDIKRIAEEMMDVPAANKKAKKEQIAPIEIQRIATEVTDIYAVSQKAKTQPQTGQSQYNQAVALFYGENYEGALKHFTNLIRQSKQSDNINELYSYRAECHFHLKNYHKFFSDVNRIPEQLRTARTMELSDQATRLLYVPRANEPLVEQMNQHEINRIVEEESNIYAAINKTKKEPQNALIDVSTIELVEIPKVDPPPAIDNSEQELYDQAVALFVGQNYENALELFTYFIQKSKQSDLYNINELYAYRAECNFHMKNYDKFRSDVKRIPKQLRTNQIRDLSEQAVRLSFIAKADEALKKIRAHQRDSSAIEVSLSILTSVLDIRPKPITTFEEKRFMSYLLHNRALLNFQMRRYAQGIQDAYQNTQIVDKNPDFHLLRNSMYNELIPYLKTMPKETELYRNFGGKTCEEYKEVKTCVKNSKKQKSKGGCLGFLYCCSQ